MRSLTKAAAACATVLAACGGGTGGTSDGSGGGAVASWHRTVVGDSFPVLDVMYDPLSEGSVTLDVSSAGTYAAYAGMNQYEPYTRRWDGASWTAMGGTPRTATYLYGGVMAAARTAAGEPVLIWPEQPDFQEAAIHSARYADGAWIPMGDPVAVGNTGSVGEIRAVPAAAGPVMSWTIWAQTTDVVHVARWSGSGWVELGAPRTPVKYGGVALAATPEGDPVLAYAAPDGTAVVERWSSSVAAWTPLPSLGIAGATRVEVSVDAAGAIYVNVPKVNLSGTAVDVDAVWRLAPGAQAWSSLGLPPGFTPGTSRMTLLGLPGAGGGVAAAWIQGGARIARYTGTGWETVYAPATTQYAQLRPMLAATSADDLWFAYVSHYYEPSMIVWRLQKY